MRLSRYFLPILKENPREAEIVSHRLMLRAGMIRQQGQGSFSWLPLGKRVVVVATLDNLLKGAATQAMQNLNLALGFDGMSGIPLEKG